MKIEEKFVNYDISLKLKEIGFDEPCFGWFSENKNLILYKNPLTFYSKNSSINWNRNFFKRMKFQLCSAPLYQDVIDWFIEEYEIHISVVPYVNDNRNIFLFELLLNHKENEFSSSSNNAYERIRIGVETKEFSKFNLYPSNKEALIKGILEAIEIVKSYKNE